MEIGKNGKMEDDFENILMFIGTPCRIYSSILLTKEIKIIISIKNFKFQGCDRNETNAMHKTKQELPNCLLKGINGQRLFPPKSPPHKISCLHPCFQPLF